MKIYYRISDKSYCKVKLPGASKEFCLKNFMSVFDKEDITIIADNCSDSTIDFVSKYNKEVIATKLSNAGSFAYAMNLSLKLDPNQSVYYVEDDYLHKPTALECLKEGLERSEYVTLYDHPDKYEDDYQYGEESYVFKTRHTHWRTTISTCMTFATKVKHMKDSLPIWQVYTSGTHPHDYSIFLALNKIRKRLSVSIPGQAAHVDLTYPIQKNLVEEHTEDWVVDILEQELLSKAPVDLGLDLSIYKGVKKLQLLDALIKMKQ